MKAGVEPWNKKQKVPSRPACCRSARLWNGTSLNRHVVEWHGFETLNHHYIERRNGSPSGRIWLLRHYLARSLPTPGSRGAFRAEAQAERKRGRSRRRGRRANVDTRALVLELYPRRAERRRGQGVEGWAVKWQVRCTPYRFVDSATTKRDSPGQCHDAPCDDLHCAPVPPAGAVGVVGGETVKATGCL